MKYDIPLERLRSERPVDLAREFGCHRQTIMAQRRNHGLTRPMRRAPANPVRRGQEVLDILRSWPGCTLADVAEELQVRTSDAYGYLRTLELGARARREGTRGSTRWYAAETTPGSRHREVRSE